MSLTLVKSRIFKVAGLLALLFGVVVLGLKGVVSGAQSHYGARETLAHALETHREINENILRAGASLDKNYDALTTNVSEMQEACGLLEKKVVNAEAVTHFKLELVAAVAGYCDAVQRQINAVEKFKSYNSILRNSLRYLPLLTSEMTESELKYVSRDILADLLIFAIHPQAELETKIHSRLKSLKIFAQPSGKTTTAFLASFQSHARVVLKSAQDRTQAQERALGESTDAGLQKIIGLYEASYESSSSTSKIYHFGLVGLCLFFAAWLVSLFMNLQRKNEIITHMNTHLEEKVAARTHELSKALVELKEKQAMLLQTTKMSALGEMAGGIAHEINTPLGSILLNAELLEDMAQASGNLDMKARLSKVVAVVQRIAKIISGLRRFCRDTSQDEKTSVSVRTVVEDTLAMCQEKFKSQGVELDVAKVSPDLEVNCVPEQIAQVLLNLLNNSLDALSAPDFKGDKWVRVEAVANGDGVHIDVIDSGSGLTEAVQAKLMQPFFTTKEIGKGTGLGLSISKGIVDSHNGRFFYDKTSSHTRFTLILPVGRRTEEAA